MHGSTDRQVFASVEARKTERGASQEAPRRSARSAMATLQHIVAEKFLAELAEKGTVDSAKIEALRALLRSGRRIKADDLVKIFSTDGRDVA